MRAYEGEWSETLAAASAAIADKYDIGDLEGDLNDVAIEVCSFNSVLDTLFCTSACTNNQPFHRDMSLTKRCQSIAQLLADKEVMSNCISASKDGHGLTMDLEVLSNPFQKLTNEYIELLSLSSSSYCPVRANNTKGLEIKTICVYENTHAHDHFDDLGTGGYQSKGH